MKNKKVEIIIGTFLLMLCSFRVFAQNNTPPAFNDGNTNVEDTAPISTLVALGLIAGAVYGIKKMK